MIAGREVLNLIACQHTRYKSVSTRKGDSDGCAIYRAIRVCHNGPGAIRHDQTINIDWRIIDQQPINVIDARLQTRAQGTDFQSRCFSWLQLTD